MLEPTGATNINQVDDNEPFSEYNGDDYPIVSNDAIQAVISLFKKLYYYLCICTNVQYYYVYV